MTLGGRSALAAISALIGVFGTWAIYHTGVIGRPRLLQEPIPHASFDTPSTTPAPATLWLLSIGVSDHADPELALEFADLDAEAVADTVQAAAQQGSFQQVRTLVLTNSQVTRESMLGALSDFLGQAGPDDIVLLFVAGHGVRDLRSGGFYFLPFPADAENLLTEGIRMSDFDELLRVVRRNVRAVIVMLDTCHAGALNVPSMQLESADEIASQISAGEGFFLIAASRPGEESMEMAELGHGAFTYALLEALQGAADTNGDGTVSASELFGYVARRVPQLTGGRQHPYHKIEGTDPLLFEISGTLAPTSPPVLAAARPSPTAAPSGIGLANSIGVMEFQNLRADAQNEWIQKALRVAFNTELSKVNALRVFSPELIDRAARRQGSDALYTARELGIGRLVTGSYHVTGDTLRIDARLVDAATGVNEASDSVEGKLDDFFSLQKQLVLSMLRRLRVHVSAEEGASIETETNTDVDAYRLLLESEGVVEHEPAKPTASASQPPGPQSSLRAITEWLAEIICATALADDSEIGVPTPVADPSEPTGVPSPSTENDITRQANDFLERYERAIEAKNLDAVRVLYVSFTPSQVDALRDYFETATDLRVEMTEATIESDERGIVVTFTRRDHFTDAKSGRPVRLEVRLSKILVHKDGEWKIRGKK